MSQQLLSGQADLSSAWPLQTREKMIVPRSAADPQRARASQWARCFGERADGHAVAVLGLSGHDLDAPERTQEAGSAGVLGQVAAHAGRAPMETATRQASEQTLRGTVPVATRRRRRQPAVQPHLQARRRDCKHPAKGQGTRGGGGAEATAEANTEERPRAQCPRENYQNLEARAHMVQWYHTRSACGRPRVQSPVSPCPLAQNEFSREAFGKSKPSGLSWTRSALFTAKWS